MSKHNQKVGGNGKPAKMTPPKPATFQAGCGRGCSGILWVTFLPGQHNDIRQYCPVCQELHHFQGDTDGSGRVSGYLHSIETIIAEE